MASSHCTSEHRQYSPKPSHRPAHLARSPPSSLRLISRIVALTLKLWSSPSPSLPHDASVSPSAFTAIAFVTAFDLLELLAFSSGGSLLGFEALRSPIDGLRSSVDGLRSSPSVDDNVVGTSTLLDLDEVEGVA